MNENVSLLFFHLNYGPHLKSTSILSLHHWLYFIVWVHFLTPDACIFMQFQVDKIFLQANNLYNDKTLGMFSGFGCIFSKESVFEWEPMCIWSWGYNLERARKRNLTKILFTEIWFRNNKFVQLIIMLRKVIHLAIAHRTQLKIKSGNLHLLYAMNEIQHNRHNKNRKQSNQLEFNCFRLDRIDFDWNCATVATGSE